MSDSTEATLAGDAGGRTAVLLGAGASADAGLLLTSGLASAVVEKANKSSANRHRAGRHDWVRALNAVYAGMVGYQGARGDNPLSAVNIETLISAVRLLRRRDDHEVAPFVASWSSALSNFASSTLPTQSGKAILDAVVNGMGSSASFADRDITEAVAQIARVAVRPGLEKPFADAEEFILRSLMELLSAHKGVAYLNPLLDLAHSQRGGVDVITLNYDLTVETAASQHGVVVNRGVESWRPGEILRFPMIDGVLNLMKVHGSLDWRIERTRSTDQRDSRLVPYSVTTAPVTQPDEDRPRDLPWIVVGDREKLATDGPTLALNFAAQSALQRASHLAVIGYSFGDDHINSMIRDWLSADETRTMSVLDLQWPRETDHLQNSDFRSALLDSYGAQQRYDGEPIDPRVLPVEGRTSEKLAEVLSGRPSRAPDPLAEASVSRDKSALRIEIIWHGAELANARVTASLTPDASGTRGYPDVPLYDRPPLPKANSSEQWERRLRGTHWPSGSTMTLYAAAETSLPLQLQIRGASIVGSFEWNGTVGV